MKKIEVAIIGAGTAGLTARRQVAAHTSNYLVFDGGELGTTCARVGCMPSKVLIQAANDYYRLQKIAQEGIEVGASKVHGVQVMKHVRQLRDRFTSGVIRSHENWQEHLIRHHVRFIDEHTFEAGGEKYFAEKIIIATGSSPFIPDQWQQYSDFIMTTDQFFELEDLPDNLAVIGMGVIGIELGQALARLGKKVHSFSSNRRLGGLQDPVIQNYAVDLMAQEMDLSFQRAKPMGVSSSGKLIVGEADQQFEFDRVLLTMGRRANLSQLAHPIFENAQVDAHTMQLKGHPHIFIAGDANSEKPLLHEAADEGVIAGRNAMAGVEKNYRRRVFLSITFSEPNIVMVGENFLQLSEKKVDFVTGSVSFEGQGRSLVKLKNKGLLHVYVQRQTGEILGAEMIAPDGEHLGHLIAWAISCQLSVLQVLALPFYHPVVEEGLRTALRDAAQQTVLASESLEVFPL